MSVPKHILGAKQRWILGSWHKNQPTTWQAHCNPSVHPSSNTQSGTRLPPTPRVRSSDRPLRLAWTRSRTPTSSTTGLVTLHQFAALHFVAFHPCTPRPAQAAGRHPPPAFVACSWSIEGQKPPGRPETVLWAGANFPNSPCSQWQERFGVRHGRSFRCPSAIRGTPCAGLHLCQGDA